MVSDFIDDKDGSVIESLSERIIGRYTAKKVINPETKEVIIDKMNKLQKLLQIRLLKLVLRVLRSEAYLLVVVKLVFVKMLW